MNRRRTVVRWPWTTALIGLLGLPNLPGCTGPTSSPAGERAGEAALEDTARPKEPGGQPNPVAKPSSHAGGAKLDAKPRPRRRRISGTGLIDNARTYAPADDVCRPKRLKNPFVHIDYDRVEVLGYPEGASGIGDDRRSVNPRRGAIFLDEAVVTRMPIKGPQLDAVLALLGNPESYGSSRSACFTPRHSLHFYRGDDLVGFGDICFECNAFESAPYIAAADANNIPEDGACLPSNGFSEASWKRLRAMCQTWRVGHCPVEDVWFGHQDGD